MPITKNGLCVKGLCGMLFDYIDFLFSVLLIIFETVDVDTPS